jgi:hypothetical protein
MPSRGGDAAGTGNDDERRTPEDKVCRLLSGWLGFVDTFRTRCIDPTREIRLMFEQVRAAPSGNIMDVPAPKRRYGGVPKAEQVRGRTHSP